VDVGDLLVFHSRVLYTEQADSATVFKDTETVSKTVTLLHIEVEAWVTVPEQVSAHISNSFYFTYVVDAPQIRKVLPSNIDEARRVVMRMSVDVEQAKEDDYEI